MRAGIVVNVTRADRLRLEAIVADRSAPQKHVWRAKVILATADGCGTAEIMRRSGKSKPVVWTWQARFMAEGIEGLLRDKTRKSKTFLKSLQILYLTDRRGHLFTSLTVPQRVMTRTSRIKVTMSVIGMSAGRGNAKAGKIAYANATPICVALRQVTRQPRTGAVSSTRSNVSGIPM